MIGSSKPDLKSKVCLPNALFFNQSLKPAKIQTISMVKKPTNI